MISFSALVASLALAGVAAAQGCPQASRFGNTVVSPAAPALLKAGDTLTITTNYTCADQFDIKPVAVDYLITVPTNNNGHEPDILLTRRTNVLTIDTFTVTIPHFPVFFAGADYELFTELTYPIDGTDGNPVLISGGQLTPLNIQATS